MGFAASSKSVVSAVKSAMRRDTRFTTRNERRSTGALPRTQPKQSVRTSSSNPAKSVGRLSDGGAV